MGNEDLVSGQEFAVFGFLKHSLPCKIAPLNSVNSQVEGVPCDAGDLLAKVSRLRCARVWNFNIVAPLVDIPTPTFRLSDDASTEHTELGTGGILTLTLGEGMTPVGFAPRLPNTQ